MADTNHLDEEFLKLKVITQEELDEHHEDSEQPWIVVNGYVCDVSEYRFEHPGGESIIVEHAASDASEAFGNVGHSGFANSKMKLLAVGRLKDYVPKKPQESKQSGNPVFITIFSLVVLVVIAYLVNRYVRG